MGGGFFSSEEFLGAIAAACHPGKRWSVEPVEVDGRHFRVLFVEGKTAGQTWLHPFFHEEAPLAEREPVRRIPFLQSVCHGIVEAPCLSLDRPFQPAPFVDWTRFRDWQDYQSFSHEGPYPAMWKTVARSARVLERDVGTVEYIPHDPDPATLDSLFAWKALQYRRTGALDRFLLPATREVYRQLQRRDLLVVSVLKAGGKVAAGIVAYRWEGRYYARLVVYNTGFARYSPGAILMQRSLRDSFDAGDRQFDLLAGGEQYKWLYATHARILGPVGRRPFRARVEHAARRRLGAWRHRSRQERTAVPGHRGE